MNNRSIAIIGSGEMAVIIVENAKKMGIRTHSFSNNMNDRVVGVSDCHHNISIFDVDQIVKECKRNNVEGVLPTTELTVSIAAKVANKLGLCGMPIEIAEVITDKGYVREKAHQLKHIKQPEYYVWNKNEKLPIMQKYPVVVKPTAMGGKRGVSVVYSQNELHEAINYAIDNMPSSKTRIIIESFIS